MALSRWRREVNAPARTCQWHELHEYLETHGCKRDVLNGPVTWHGVSLKKEAGTETTSQATQQDPMSDEARELFEERAAIMEYDGHMPREEAERLAWKCVMQQINK